MRVLVTGVRGQLGHDVVKHLSEMGIEHRGVDMDDFDITVPEEVMDYCLEYQPDTIIHCAAYTAVDKAETDMVTCMKVNGEGTLNMVRAASRLDAVFVYISTDYVFSGNGEEPFEVNSPVDPKNVYGLSKLQGEYAVKGQLKRYFIVRTSWVYGLNGSNFVRTMRRLGQEKSMVSVVNDQIGSPTYSDDLAKLLCQMITTKKYGVYHATNEGFCSWAEFADEIMFLSHLRCQVFPVPSSDYPTPAKRPMNSRLSKASLEQAGFQKLPDWEDALKRYIQQLREEEEV